MSTHQERVLILHTDDKQVFIRYALLLTKYQLLSTIYFFYSGLGSSHSLTNYGLLKEQFDILLDTFI